MSLISSKYDEYRSQYRLSYGAYSSLFNLFFQIFNKTEAAKIFITTSYQTSLISSKNEEYRPQYYLSQYGEYYGFGIVRLVIISKLIFYNRNMW
jgi:hypothetical protein